MEVLVIGGHGKVGLRLLRLLARDGHRGRGVIRKAEQASNLEAAGAEAVLCDLERGGDLRPTSAPPTRSCSPPGPGPGAGPSASGRSTTARPSSRCKRLATSASLGS
jgi:NAD(P)-dependent dehydrogenase (short-subunit alcohol dehydrogenase family)